MPAQEGGTTPQTQGTASTQDASPISLTRHQVVHLIWRGCFAPLLPELLPAVTPIDRGSEVHQPIGGEPVAAPVPLNRPPQNPARRVWAARLGATIPGTSRPDSWCMAPPAGSEGAGPRSGEATVSAWLLTPWDPPPRWKAQGDHEWRACWRSSRRHRPTTPIPADSSPSANGPDGWMTVPTRCRNVGGERFSLPAGCPTPASGTTTP
jgi:hypothetical protein